MIADSISSGHVWAADLLFLIAAIVFVVEAVLIVAGGASTISRGILPAVGLALVAFAWFLL